jgi:hypothetical protein
VAEFCDCGWQLPKVAHMARFGPGKGVPEGLFDVLIIYVIYCPNCAMPWESEVRLGDGFYLGDSTREQATMALHLSNKAPGDG